MTGQDPSSIEPVKLVGILAILLGLPVQAAALLLLPGLFGVAAVLVLWAIGLMATGQVSGQRCRMTAVGALDCLLAAAVVVIFQIQGS